MKYVYQMTNEQLAEAKALIDTFPAQKLYKVITDDEKHMSGVYVGTVDRGTGHDQDTGLGDLDRLSDEAVAIFSWQSAGFSPRGMEYDRDERYANFLVKAPETIRALLSEVVSLRSQIEAQPVAVHHKGVGRWVL